MKNSARKSKISCVMLAKQAEAPCSLSQQNSCIDRKSTRLNSSHLVISYAVFCLKKKKKYSNQEEGSSPNGHPLVYWHMPAAAPDATVTLIALPILPHTLYVLVHESALLWVLWTC